jgi:hypothetical protein
MAGGGNGLLLPSKSTRREGMKPFLTLSVYFELERRKYERKYWAYPVCPPLQPELHPIPNRRRRQWLQLMSCGGGKWWYVGVVKVVDRWRLVASLWRRLSCVDVNE